MAKVTFTKLNTVKTMAPKEVQIGGLDIEIKQYLPIEEKLELVQTVLQNALEEQGFFNPIKINMFLELEMVKEYTNISFTETQLNNIPKLYDSLMLNGIVDMIMKNVPKSEYDFLKEGITECGLRLVQYNTSLVGILKTVTQEYDATKLDVESITKMIGDPEQLKFVKQIFENQL